MNFVTINIRGIGVVGKSAWVKGLVGKHGVDFDKIWGSGGYDCESVGASGNSGGLINIWNVRKFKKCSSVEDMNFLLTKGTLVEDGTVINVVNVYAPQKANEKRLLWDRLRNLMQGDTGMWILLGDFNTVRWKEERKNSKFRKGMALDFNCFIDEANLQEFKMSGNRFTFMTGAGSDVLIPNRSVPVFFIPVPVDTKFIPTRDTNLKIIII